MILVTDVYYRETDAKTVGLLFQEWTDSSPAEVVLHYSTGYGEYEPGAFYKRELPCLLEMIATIDLSVIDMIIVDGYVYVDDNRMPGLGYYLYEALGKTVPVIGVAKKAFYHNKEITIPVCRGSSRSPLYITSVGIDTGQAASFVEKMHGNFRIPTLLKLVDQYSREL
ncbi:MAG: endonuclease V [Tannerellaceae bacterium]|nr:endonuclease V [Tannerellaceae bacterium]